MAQSSVEMLEQRWMLAFGRTDVSFGTMGRSVTPMFTLAASPEARDLIVARSGGSIYAAGDAGVVRYTSAGTADATFAEAGVLKFPPGLFLAAEALDPFGNLLVLDRAGINFELRKFNSAGDPVTSFGVDDDGVAPIPAPSSVQSFNPTALAVQHDGKIVVAGQITFTVRRIGSGRSAVYRFNSDGSIDSAFGSKGIVQFQLGWPHLASNEFTIDRVAGAAVLDDGSILVGGGGVYFGRDREDNELEYGQAMFSAAHITPDGAMDLTYGENGVGRVRYDADDRLQRAVLAAGNSNYNVLPSAFAATPDGSAILAARDGTLALGLIKPNGTDFTVTHGDRGFPLAKPSDMVMLSDGRAVLLGQPLNDATHGLVMAAVSAKLELGNAVYTDDLNATTTDLDADGRGAVSVADDGKLLVAGAPIGVVGMEVCKFTPGGTTEPRPDEFPNARNNDIVKDSSGALHVAFYDAADHDLKYAYRAPNGLWNAPVVVDAAQWCGTFLSIAVNSHRQPVIAYCDGGHGDLKLATTTNTGRAWTLETVDSRGSVGQYPSLQIDKLDRPTVTYYNRSRGDLMFAVKNGSRWSFQTVDSAGDVGRSSVLIPSAKTDRFTVAYTDRSGTIKWAARQPAGNWIVQTVTTTRGGAAYLSMAYSYYYGPAISFYDAYASDLKLAYFRGGRWQVKLLASSGSQGMYSSLVFADFFAAPSVYAYNRTTDSVRLFDAATAPRPAASDAILGGGQFLSIDFNGKSTDAAYYDAHLDMVLVRPAPPPEAVF